MSAFSRGFNFGFTAGLFNSTFGSFNPFFGGYCNFNSWYQTPMFFTPIFNFNNFTPYFTPQPMFTGWNNFNLPKFNTPSINTVWNNTGFYALPSTPTITLGDTFVRSEKPKNETSDPEKTSNPKTRKTKPPKQKTTNTQREVQVNTTPKTKTQMQAQIGTLKTTSLRQESLTANTAKKEWHEWSDKELIETYGDYKKDITNLYNGTAEDLNKYLADKGALKGLGEAFIRAQEEFGISASVLVGICMNETGKGTDKKAYSINNLGGIRKFVNGKATWKEYKTKEDCIMDMARFLKSGYVDNPKRSLTKLYEINNRYCPVSDPTDKKSENRYWARNVNKYTNEAEQAKAQV